MTYQSFKKTLAVMYYCYISRDKHTKTINVTNIDDRTVAVVMADKVGHYEICNAKDGIVDVVQHFARTPIKQRDYPDSWQIKGAQDYVMLVKVIPQSEARLAAVKFQLLSQQMRWVTLKMPDLLNDEAGNLDAYCWPIDDIDVNKTVMNNIVNERDVYAAKAKPTDAHYCAEHVQKVIEANG